MEFYFALNKIEMLLFAGKWMALENMNLREIRLRKPKPHIFSHKWTRDLIHIQAVL
jgi:hypothetical protein